MLDQFFYNIDMRMMKVGSDWAIIGLFVLMMFILAYALAALHIDRLLHAGMAFIIIAGVTYWPCVMFPSLLESIYLKFSLLTPWYIKQVPSLLRFPTIWLFSILLPVTCWLVAGALLDLVKYGRQTSHS